MADPPLYDLRLGNALTVLKQLPEQSVHCCVTSPPYWSLRDYGLPPTEWGDGTTACLGLEETPAQFVAHIVEVFREVRRVLRRDGVCFVNLGDSYAAGKCGRDDEGQEDLARRAAAFGTGTRKSGQKEANGVARKAPAGLKPKDLCLMPHRCAIALQEDGWWVRQDMVWAKLNPLPESVSDRATRAHEYIFHLVRSDRYYWDAEAVKEDAGSAGERRLRFSSRRAYAMGREPSGNEKPGAGDDALRGNHRNLRSVISLATEAYPHAHFACYPTKLIEPLIRAGSSEKGCCPKCGAPWRRLVEREYLSQAQYKRKPGDPLKKCTTGDITRFGDGVRVETLGWEPSCACEPVEPPTPCTILDAFMGSGTTGQVALQHGRRFLGIEMQPSYLPLVAERLARYEGLGVAPEEAKITGPRTLSLGI